MHHLAEQNGVNGGLPEIPRSVDDLFHRFWGPRAPRAGTWRPAVDIVETAAAYVLRLDLPGIRSEDIEVLRTGDRLTVRGGKPAPADTDDEIVHVRERVAGSFEKNFRLPAAAATGDVEAEAKHGVLTIRVMKAKDAQPQKIQIH